jgi:hypothetical protein
LEKLSAQGRTHGNLPFLLGPEQMPVLVGIRAILLAAASIQAAASAINHNLRRSEDIDEHLQTGPYLLVQVHVERRLVRESTKRANDKVARQVEAAHRTSVAKGEVGIRKRKSTRTLKEFLKQDFLRHAETRHGTKPLTLRYYRQGSAMLLKSSLGSLCLKELTDQHAQEFAVILLAYSRPASTGGSEQFGAL